MGILLVGIGGVMLLGAGFGFFTGDVPRLVGLGLGVFFATLAFVGYRLLETAIYPEKFPTRSLFGLVLGSLAVALFFSALQGFFQRGTGSLVLSLATLLLELGLVYGAYLMYQSGQGRGDFGMRNYAGLILISLGLWLSVAGLLNPAPTFLGMVILFLLAAVFVAPGYWLLRLRR